MGANALLPGSSHGAIHEASGDEGPKISDLISSQLAGVDSYLELKRKELGTLDDEEDLPKSPERVEVPAPEKKSPPAR